MVLETLRQNLGSFGLEMTTCITSLHKVNDIYSMKLFTLLLSCVTAEFFTRH